MLRTRRNKSLAGEEMTANDGIKESEALASNDRHPD